MVEEEESFSQLGRALLIYERFLVDEFKVEIFGIHLWAQLFTSLMTYLLQDINGDYAFGACPNRILP